MTALQPGPAESLAPDSPPEQPTEESAVPARRYRFRAARRVLRQPLAVACLVYIVLLCLAAVFADVVAPYPPAAIDLTNVLSGPTTEHWLGTDQLGRDVLSRIIHAGRFSLVHAGIATVTFLVVAVSSGVIAGFLGRWTDRIFTWVVDLTLAMPSLIVLLVTLTIFGGDLVVAMIALGLLAAPAFARIIRGVTLAVRNELYVSAARVSGLPTTRIIFRHVLPRVSGPIIVMASLFSGGALLIDAGLSYLGFGPQPPIPTWGNMMVEAAASLNRQPWLLVPPGVVLALGTFAFGLLGDFVRDATADSMPARPTRPTRRRATRPANDDGADSADPIGAALLEVRSLTVTLPGPNGMTTLVENVSLDVHAGETVAIVGESGCGKSITASAVLGLLPAGGVLTGGRVVFDGVDYATAGRRDLRRLRGIRVGMILQDPMASLDPVFTVGQQLHELVRRHHGGNRKAAGRRVLQLLDDVRLPDPDQVARRYPHQLSGGMAQRVAIAMALAGEPQLLIADEPTTALDVTVQAEILDLLRRLQAERGMAILLITHNWGVVADMCRRAYVMYAGQVVESCTVDDAFDRPLHPYSAGLLRSTPRRARPRTPLGAIPGTVPSPGSWPQGCHFAPRCPLAGDECRVAPIPLLEPSAGHLTRCIRHQKMEGAPT